MNSLTEYLAEIEAREKVTDDLTSSAGDIPALLSLVRKYREALERAEKLAGIASDWDLGTNGEVEIDDEWISCTTLREEFHDALAFDPRKEMPT